MRYLSIKVFFTAIPTLLCVLFAQCGSGGTDIAGGSGTGNPGGSVVVAVIADSESSSLQKINTLAMNTPGPAYKGPKDGSGQKPSLTVEDSDGLGFMVDSAKLHIQSIQFILESGQQCSRLIEGFDGGLRCDSDGVVLDGPFVVDLLTGVSTPALDSVRLPEASYAGIHLRLGPQAGSLAPTTESTLEIYGTFSYENESHFFSMELSIDQPASFRRAGAPVLVSRNDTTHFSVKLDPAQWFDSLSFKDCLDTGALTLDQNGDLFIGRGRGSGACRNIDESIGRNVIGSGRLEAGKR